MAETDLEKYATELVGGKRKRKTRKGRCVIKQRTRKIDNKFLNKNLYIKFFIYKFCFYLAGRNRTSDPLITTVYPLQSDALPIELQREFTLPDGFEPPTYRLTADRSTS